jgi:hypothetical protein
VWRREEDKKKSRVGISNTDQQEENTLRLKKFLRGRQRDPRIRSEGGMVELRSIGRGCKNFGICFIEQKYHTCSGKGEEEESQGKIGEKKRRSEGRV